MSKQSKLVFWMSLLFRLRLPSLGKEFRYLCQGTRKTNSHWSMFARLNSLHNCIMKSLDKSYHGPLAGHYLAVSI